MDGIAAISIRLGSAKCVTGPFFDRFCDDMDANLREMGVGDLTVPKRMQAFGEAFYGRAAAYDVAFDAGGDAPAKALCKNILNGQDMENARRLATYAQTVMAYLGDLDDATFHSAGWAFPAPAAASGQISRGS